MRQFAVVKGGPCDRQKQDDIKAIFDASETFGVSLDTPFCLNARNEIFMTLLRFAPELGVKH